MENAHGQEPNETIITEPEPMNPEQAGAVDPPDADEADEADEMTSAETQSELERARRQAAKYRTRLRTVEQERDALKAQLDAAQQATPDPAQDAEVRIAQAERRALIAEAAAEANIPVAALKAFRTLETAVDADAVTAAIDALKPFLAGSGSGPQKPPAEAGRTLSQEELIAEAEKAGDIRTALRLKSARLAELAAQRK